MDGITKCRHPVFFFEAISALVLSLYPMLLLSPLILSRTVVHLDLKVFMCRFDSSNSFVFRRRSLRVYENGERVGICNNKKITNSIACKNNTFKSKWAIVKWKTNKINTYPIGYENIYSLVAEK